MESTHAYTETETDRGEEDNASFLERERTKQNLSSETPLGTRTADTTATKTKTSRNTTVKDHFFEESTAIAIAIAILHQEPSVISLSFTLSPKFAKKNTEALKRKPNSQRRRRRKKKEQREQRRAEEEWKKSTNLALPPK